MESSDYLLACLFDLQTKQTRLGDLAKEEVDTSREKIQRQHQIKQLAASVADVAKKVEEGFRDENNVRADKLKAMAKDPLNMFNQELDDILNMGTEETSAFPAFEDPKPKVSFTGEERWGKHIDLHPQHLKFINIVKEHEEMPYSWYLSKVMNFSSVDEQIRRSPEWKEYITDLMNYLKEFFHKTHPLVNSEEMETENDEEFENNWNNNNIDGWNIPGSQGTSAEKPNPNNKPLFCVYCGKEFSSEGVFKNHLRGKKHKRAVKNEATLIADCKEIAKLEACAKFFFDLLSYAVDMTKRYVEKKLTRRLEEINDDMDDAEAKGDIAEESDSETDEEPIYNPLNLPLGWDGKPIPYWLYKLHGLGNEFKCEICGDHSFWGRRSFDQHFQQWRHAHGMRSLGIPNTKHFHDIVKIADAQKLYAKLKQQLRTESWDPSMEEEFEDSDGNVVNRKTYEDLAKQGLL